MRLALLFFLAVTTAGAEERPLQLLSGRTVESVQSTPSDHTWWITGERIDPIAESQAADAQTDAPDKRWAPVPVPADVAPLHYADHFREGVYYRKLFRLPADQAESLSIRVGEITDRDRIYLNGVRIAQTGEWDSQLPQAYDRLRIYPLPDSLLRKDGANCIIIHVQGYFPSELGIYRDRTQIGPTEQILKSFYLENIYQLVTLAVYGTAGGYFLFLFLRQRHDRENLYFAAFVLLFLIYSFLRTQFKFVLDIPISFFWLKRIQYNALFLLLVTFYFFIRHYFELPDKPWARIWDRFYLIFTIVPIATCVSLYVSDSAIVWEKVNRAVVQPGWILHAAGSLFLLIRGSFQRNTDAIAMITGVTVTLVTAVLDILASQNIINLPTLSTYSFFLFIVSIAFILANRFVRISEHNIALNVELTGTNKAMTRFVPREFLSFLGHDRIIDVNIGDQTQREMTILFSDIRSFTTLSEGMTPKENFDFINSYLRRVGPIIRKHGGFIDKYIGDAVMALFPGNAQDALEASIEMHQTVRKYNVRRLEVGYKPITIGIGLHTGMLMLGTIGEEERMDGTVISDNVNLASRLESLTKQYGSSILISQAVYEKLPDPGKYRTRFVDRVIVKGKSQSVSVIEVLDSDPEDLMKAKIATRDMFERAVSLYQTQDFRQAAQVLGRILEVNSEDKAASLYLERANYYAEHGVPLDWEGVEHMKSK